jgi:hypothetical protein
MDSSLPGQSIDQHFSIHNAITEFFKVHHRPQIKIAATRSPEELPELFGA